MRPSRSSAGRRRSGRTMGWLGGGVRLQATGRHDTGCARACSFSGHHQPADHEGGGRAEGGRIESREDLCRSGCSAPEPPGWKRMASAVGGGTAAERAAASGSRDGTIRHRQAASQFRWMRRMPTILLLAALAVQARAEPGPSAQVGPQATLASQPWPAQARHAARQGGAAPQGEACASPARPGSA